MEIRISTLVKGNYLEVLQQFDQELLEKLTPPGLQIKLLQYDGSKRGDIVHIRIFILGFIMQEWVSEITDTGRDKRHAFFIDEGKTLPTFLRSWKHAHIVENHQENSKIIDKIEFRTPFKLLDWAIFPLLYLQFAYRKPIYKKVFGKPSGTLPK